MTYKQLPPKVTCCEADLYAVNPGKPTTDQRIESIYFDHVDRTGAWAIRELEKRGTLDDGLLGALAMFVANQYTRVPSFKRLISGFYVRAAEEVSRITFATTDRAKEVMDHLEKNTGTVLNTSPASVVDAVQGKHIHISATEKPFLENMIRFARDLEHLLKRFEWAVMRASCSTGFVLSDNPLVLVPPRGATSVGFAVRGTAKYFPLTRALCLRFGDVDFGISYGKIDREAVRIVNQNIAANSSRFIMGPDQVQLRSVVSRSGSAVQDKNDRFVVEFTHQDENRSIERVTNLPSRCFYPKNV